MGIQETITGLLVLIIFAILVAFWKKILGLFKKKSKKKPIVQKEPLIQKKPPIRKPDYASQTLSRIKEKIDEKREDKRILGEIISSLQFINYLPNDPDKVIKSISDKLFEIQEKARKIRSKNFDEIKAKLIEYGEKVETVNVNIGLGELQKLFIRNGQTSSLINELKEITDSKTEKKKVKAINETLEKAILEQLNEKYPSTIESDEEILPKHEDRDEIRNHLFHLRNKGLIESQIIEEEERDLPVGYKYIRLTPEGMKQIL